MNDDFKIYREGYEKYPLFNIVLSNFTMLLWIAIGAVGCWFLYPLIAWIYIGVALFVVFFLMRKLVCTNCYYYGKWCSTGWGKLSALFFKKGEVNRFSKNPALKAAPIVYGSLTLIPLVLTVISMVMKFSFIKLGVIVLLILIGFYSGSISRKRTCARCKMRIVCPGSAAK